MITFIWAEDQNHGIGYQGHLPWHLPADLKFFKKTTMGHPMLMGRKTFASLPHVLPGRQHLVLTHSQSLRQKYRHNVQVTFFSSWAQVNEYLRAHKQEEICAIGGLSIFQGLRAAVTTLKVTKIHHVFPADTFMCPLNYHHFSLVKKEEHPASSKNPYAYDFLIYRRKNTK